MSLVTVGRVLKARVTEVGLRENVKKESSDREYRHLFLRVNALKGRGNGLVS